MASYLGGLASLDMSMLCLGVGLEWSLDPPGAHGIDRQKALGAKQQTLGGRLEGPHSISSETTGFFDCVLVGDTYWPLSLCPCQGLAGTSVI